MRISCAWNPGLAKTFRNKSGKIFKTWGRNMANLSDEEKRFFIADDGKELLNKDVAGAEAVIVGYLCRPGKYRDLTIYGVKHHSYIAAQLYRQDWKKETPYDVDHLLGLSIKELSEHPQWKSLAKIIKSTDALVGKARRYYIGKKTGLSFNYLEGPNTFRFTLLKESEGKVILTSKEAEMFKILYEIMFPEIVDWQKRVEETVKRDRLIRNLYGFPFNITSHISDKLIRECIAWTPQSTVGVLASVAFARMQLWSEENPEYQCDVLGTVHDSVVTQQPPEYTSVIESVLGKLLEVEFTSPYDGVKFRMKTETSVGQNLAKYDEEDNPFGLKDYIKLAA